MINHVLNFLAEEHEKKYHNPILKQITDSLKLNCKIKYTTAYDIIIKTEYKFYDMND